MRYAYELNPLKPVTLLPFTSFQVLILSQQPVDSPPLIINFYEAKLFDKGLKNVTVMKKNVKNCRGWDVDAISVWED